jgi:hypothetical protein
MIQLSYEQSDATLRVQFNRPENGGRQRRVGELDTWQFHSCPLFMAGVSHGFDVRMYSRVHPSEFDQPYEVEAIFTGPNEASRYFIPGATLTIWEGQRLDSAR